MEYYPRKIEKDLEPWMKRGEIIIIKGARQTGKTTLLLHLREVFGGEYITLEDEEMKRALEREPKEFIKRFLNKKFIFIDEAQYSKEIGKTLKVLFDLYGDKIKFVVTGSGSFDIKVEIGKYLVGRAVYFELFPLDFEEFILWKKKDLHSIFLDYKKQLLDFIFENKIPEIEPIFEKEFLNSLEEYILFGGFPAIVKEENPEMKKKLLKDLVRTYLEKDVFFFFGIRHLEKFRNFLNYLAINSGSILNFSNIASDLKIDYKTCQDYLNILSNTYLVSLLNPFYRNLSTELKKSKKVYFLDPGLRNSIMENFLPLEKRSDKGFLFELFVFNELKKIFEKIRYWRTAGKAEVDFVVEFRNEILPIEVKTEPKLKKGFLSFLKSYRPKKAIVFSQKEFGVKEIGETKTIFVPLFFI
jgi:predicted AAA+ superfamily ATPase